jgi:SAM-dependent methyltransferase
VLTTTFSDNDTGGLGPLALSHPPGTFPPSPATRVALRAIGLHRGLLVGSGLDWGCGVGCLALVAARVPAVEDVLGLDLEPANVAAARDNAEALGVAGRCRFHVADSIAAADDDGRAAVSSLRGRAGFVLANPPSSTGDDGFGFRRRVLADVADLVAPGGVVFLNASAQYGHSRITGLATPGGPWGHEGVLADSGPAAFDPTVPHLASALEDYAVEEARGGAPYSFIGPTGEPLTAGETLRRWVAERTVPMTRWQVHAFVRRPLTGR